MKKKYLLIVAVLVNIIFAIALIHKQNQIVTSLYTLQQLQQEKEMLEQEKKELIFQLAKETQLSQVESFAKQQLAMRPIAFKEIKKISKKVNG